MLEERVNPESFDADKTADVIERLNNENTLLRSQLEKPKTGTVPAAKLKLYIEKLENKNKIIIELLKRQIESSKKSAETSQPDYSMIEKVYERVYESSNLIINDAKQSVKDLTDTVFDELEGSLSNIANMYGDLHDFKTKINALFAQASSHIKSVEKITNNIVDEQDKFSNYFVMIENSKANILNQLSEDSEIIAEEVPSVYSEAALDTFDALETDISVLENQLDLDFTKNVKSGKDNKKPKSSAKPAKKEAVADQEPTDILDLLSDIDLDDIASENILDESEPKESNDSSDNISSGEKWLASTTAEELENLFFNEVVKPTTDKVDEEELASEPDEQDLTSETEEKTETVNETISDVKVTPEIKKESAVDNMNSDFILETLMVDMKNDISNENNKKFVKTNEPSLPGDFDEALIDNTDENLKKMHETIRKEFELSKLKENPETGQEESQDSDINQSKETAEQKEITSNPVKVQQSKSENAIAAPKDSGTDNDRSKGEDSDQSNKTVSKPKVNIQDILKKYANK